MKGYNMFNVDLKSPDMRGYEGSDQLALSAEYGPYRISLVKRNETFFSYMRIRFTTHDTETLFNGDTVSLTTSIGGGINVTLTKRK